MRPLRTLLATALLAGSGLTALPAAAGTLTWSPPRWSNREGTNRRIDILNRQDCLNDAKVQFAVQVRNVSSGAVFEVWSGTNCDNIANRTGSGGTKTCVQVTASQTAVTATTTITVEARLQSMVMPYSTGGVDAGTKESCDLETSPGLVPRSLFFVVYNTGTTMSELSPAATPWAFKYDIKAPQPPSGLTATPGEGSLVTTFTAPSGETNLLRYRFYCSLATTPTAPTAGGGTSGTDTGGTDTGGTTTDTGGTTTDAGGTETSGTGGGGTSAGTSTSAGGTAEQVSDPNCGSDILVPGQPPPADAIDCGTVAAQAATGGETKEVLENGVQYAVAVATEDDVNNVGTLSRLACATPMEVTGFYEAYREAGGEAGGGFCSFRPARAGGLAALAALAALAGVLVWRRR